MFSRLREAQDMRLRLHLLVTKMLLSQIFGMKKWICLFRLFVFNVISSDSFEGIRSVVDLDVQLLVEIFFCSEIIR